jgi:hypothetical protein
MTQIHLDNCPTCGQSRNARWYTLHPGHVRALVKFHRAILHYGRNRVHIRKEMYDVAGDCPFKLTYDEINNFSFLRTFALVAHFDQDAPRSGEWLMTKLGAEFLKGTNFVPARKLVFNGEIMERDKRLVHVTEFRGKIPEYPKTFDHVLIPLENPPITSSLFPEPVKGRPSQTTNRWL